VSLRDTDKGEFAKATKELERFQKLTIRVGYQAVGSTDLTVIDIAIFQEFGTINIPARPFFSSAIELGREEIFDFIEKEIGDILEGKRGAIMAAERVGLFAKNKIQERIRTSPEWATPLKQSTIDAKGSDVPLIDIGELLNSVTYAILEGSSVIASG
jgi:hypothetical protein